ncbi:hypothetical protein [Methylomonas sp. YC3]
MMKLTTAICLMTSLFLTSCGKTDQPILSLLKKTVVIAEGVNAKTDEFVVINPLDSKLLPPCGKTTLPTENEKDVKAHEEESKRSQNKSSDCQTTIAKVNDEVLNAIKIQAPIEGVILKNGKEIPAKFFVSVKAVYDDPCTTIYANGYQYQQCITDQQLADLLD